MIKYKWASIRECTIVNKQAYMIKHYWTLNILSIIKYKWSSINECTSVNKQAYMIKYYWTLNILSMIKYQWTSSINVQEGINEQVSMIKY